MARDNVQDGWTLTLDHRCREPKNPSEKVFLGAGDSPRRCKFCGRTPPEVNFRSVAHVIPAAFGNRTLFSREECSDCNTNRFSRYENDLTNSLALVRALWAPRKRRGSIKLKRRVGSDPAAEVLNADAQGNARVQVVDGDPSVEVEDVGKRQIKITAELPPYRPLHVAKALARMGLFPLPIDGDPELEILRDWLMGRSEMAVAYFHTFMPGPQDREYRLRVWTSVHASGPRICVEFGSAGFRYLFPFPTSRWNPSQPWSSPPLDSAVPIPPRLTPVAVLDDAVVRGDRQSVVVQAEQVHRTRSWRWYSRRLKKLLRWVVGRG